AWEQDVSWTDADVTAAAPVLIDVGALGKGRLVDLVMAVLARVPGDLVIDAGGDIRLRGAGVRIGLEHPYDPTKAIGVVEVHDQALCASAINRRAWGSGLHHVLDARTGMPVRTWAATWAWAPDAMTADAVTTALFFDGGVELAATWNVEWVRMSTDGRVQRSPGCPAELFIAVGESSPAARN
ncbi:MAG: FAD:protein FMN transferase, partial [Microbacterium sp.]